jgi:hypothetical protein
VVSVAARGAGGDGLFFCLVVDRFCAEAVGFMLNTDLSVVGGELPPACIDKVFNAEASPVGMAGSNDRGKEDSVSPASLKAMRIDAGRSSCGTLSSTLLWQVT